MQQGKHGSKGTEIKEGLARGDKSHVSQQQKSSVVSDRAGCLLTGCTRPMDRVALIYTKSSWRHLNTLKDDLALENEPEKHAALRKSHGAECPNQVVQDAQGGEGPQ